MRIGRVVAAIAVVALVAAGAGSAGAVTRAGKAPKSVPGFDGKTITLGVITPLSGRVSLIGLPLTAGNQTYWDYLNDQKGGIAGKYQVKLAQEDSQYQPPVAVQAYDKLKSKVVMFNQILGSQITLALLPKMQADQLSASPATLDGLWVHKPYLFPGSSTYQIQTANAIDYWYRNGGKGKKICAIAQDDEFGEAGLEALDWAKKQLKLKTGPTPRFKTGEDLTAQIQQLADAKCQAVVAAATAADASAVVTKSIGLNFEPRYIALSPFWLPALAESPTLQDYLVNHVWLAAEKSIAWGDPSIPGMSQMIARQEKYTPDQKPDLYFVFGYLQSMGIAQVLERAVKNGDLSRAGIQKASNQVGTLKFGGFAGDYFYGKSAKDRNPPRTTAVFKVDPAQPGGLALIDGAVTSKTGKTIPIPK